MALPVVPPKRMLLALTLNLAGLGWLLHGQAAQLPAMLFSGALILLAAWPARKPPPPPPSEAVDYWRHFAEHMDALLPLWLGHIQLAREQIEDAAGQMVRRFDKILAALGQDAPLDEERGDILSRAEQRLHQMLDLLEQGTHLREQAGAQIHALQHHASDLQCLAGSLGQCSGQAHLLALNHEVEASRTGGQTRAIANKELQLLVNEAQQLSGQLQEKADAMLAQLQRVETLLEVPAGNAQPGSGARALQSLLGEPPAPLDDRQLRKRQEVRAAIEDILVHLQFQDRVSQILGIVQNDIDKLSQLLARSLERREEPPPDTQAWLNALRNSYTTHEQRQMHGQQNSNGAADANNITFF